MNPFRALKKSFIDDGGWRDLLIALVAGFVIGFILVLVGLL